MKNLKMKSARVAKDLTQQGLADAIGVSRQTISAIEKGIFILLMGLLSLFQSFKIGKNLMSSVAFLTLGLTLICDCWVIIKRIKKNRLEELENEE